MRRIRLVGRALPYALVSVLVVAGSYVASAQDGTGPGVTATRPPVTDQMRADMAAAVAARERAEARRRTPEARAEREESRSRYADLGREAALAVAKDAFGEIFRVAAFRPFEVPPGLRVKEFRGDHAALLEAEDPADNQLVEASGAPLSSTLGSGERDFVDLSLRRDGDSFVPRNPSVGTRIRLDGTAHVGGADGVSLRVVGAESGDEVAEDNERLFFANALEDTDVVVAPTAGGVAFTFHVRSAQAPESAQLELGLPAGASARLAASGGMALGVEVVRAGEVLGWIAPPVAWDADGVPVAASYSLDGDRVVIAFPHRGKDVRYPLYVDPDYENFGTTTQVSDWGEWVPITNNAPFTAQAPDALSRARVWNAIGPYFWDGQWAAVKWPNPRGFVRQLDAYGVSHYHSWTCAKVGVATKNLQAWKSVWAPACYQMQPEQFVSLRVTNPVYEDEAMLEFSTLGSGTRNWEGYLQAKGVRAYLGDSEAPTITNATGTPVPTVPNNSATVATGTNGWLKGGETVTVTPAATDAGLGLWGFSLYVAQGITPASFVLPNGLATWDPAQGCTGARPKRCPNRTTDPPVGQLSFQVTSAVPDGEYNVPGEVIDALGQRTPFYTRIKVDKTGPAITATGDVWNYRQGGPTPTQLDLPNTYSLTVNATDARTTTSDVKLYLDGELQPAATASAGTNGMSLVYTYDLADSDAGNHEFKIETRDANGNLTTQPIAVATSSKDRVPKLGVNVRPWDDESNVTQFFDTGTNVAGTANEDGVFEKLARNNIGYARVGFNMWKWERVGKSFTRWNDLMNAAAAHNVRVLPILYYDVLNQAQDLPLKRTPGWKVPHEPGSTYYHGPLVDPADGPDSWKAFVTAFVNHFKQSASRDYKHSIQTWEVWNEPNLYDYAEPDPLKRKAHFFEGRLAPAHYRQKVYNPAQAAIKAADPNAIVVLGGLAERSADGIQQDRGASARYLSNMFDDGAFAFNAVSIHPYFADSTYLVRNDGPGGLADGTGSFDYLRAELAQHPSVPLKAQIWATEYGWASQPEDFAGTEFNERYKAANSTDQAKKTGDYMQLLQRRSGANKQRGATGVAYPTGPTFMWPERGRDQDPCVGTGAWACWAGPWDNTGTCRKLLCSGDGTATTAPSFLGLKHNGGSNGPRPLTFPLPPK